MTSNLGHAMDAMETIDAGTFRIDRLETKPCRYPYRWDHPGKDARE